MQAQLRSDKTPIISISDVRKSYKKTSVLNGVDLNVQQGSVFALLGPNGAGKTTLIRILATLLKPDAGQITIAGFDLSKQPREIRRIIALTGQYAAVDELLTGEENMRMMGRLFHLRHEDIERRMDALLLQFDLNKAARQIVKTYSGGMRRRLDLAISLMAEPQILFLDEPTTGLDPQSRLVMWALIRDLAASGTTIFLTTQYLEEADQLADKVAVLAGGRIIAEGTAGDLKRRVGNEYLDLVLTRSQDVTRTHGLFGSQILHSDEQRRQISIVVDGSPSGLKKVLDQMEKDAIDIEALTLRKPTLDDAFLILTGSDVLMRLENGDKNG